MYYNSLVGGAWCSGSTRDSDPLSVSSILIAPATKNTFAFADVFFYETHLAVYKKSAELIFHFRFPIQSKSIKKASGTNSTRYFISIKQFLSCYVAYPWIMSLASLGLSVMMASAPFSARRAMSSASLIVQYCTAIPL